MTNPFDAINALNDAWHEKYGPMGEFWPEGRPATHNVCGACRHGWHGGCSGTRYSGGRSGEHAIVPCECRCVEAA